MRRGRLGGKEGEVCIRKENKEDPKERHSVGTRSRKKYRLEISRNPIVGKHASEGGFDKYEHEAETDAECQPEKMIPDNVV